MNGPFNPAFSAILGHVHGGGSGVAPTPLIESNFRDGIYKVSGAAVTLGDIWVEDATNWSSFDPAAITPGLGYVKTSAGTGPSYSTDLGSTVPTLASGLFGSVINLTDGFTVLFEGSLEYIIHDFVPGTYETQQIAVNNGLEFGNPPDWTTEWTFTGGVQFNKQMGQSPAQDFRDVEFIDDKNFDEVDDTESPMPASPLVLRLAATFTHDRAVYSLNGRQWVDSSGMTTPIDGSAVSNLFMNYQFQTRLIEATTALEYVAFYPKFTSDTDLMTLTAP